MSDQLANRVVDQVAQNNHLDDEMINHLYQSIDMFIEQYE